MIQNFAFEKLGQGRGEENKNDIFELQIFESILVIFSRIFTIQHIRLGTKETEIHKFKQ